MVEKIQCPRCNQTVESQSRTCPHCGVDLAFAAVLTEHALPVPLDKISRFQLIPEILVPRLGDYLISKGILKESDLRTALGYQRKKINAGEPMLIGQALLELGLIERASLDEAVTEQILQLQAALQKTNENLERRIRERTAELQNALNKLTEINQLKSNFISNISHELRTPLTHIKGYLDILSDGSIGPLTTQQSEVLHVLKRAEDRLERLIEDLIQFSLAVKGELNVHILPFQMLDLIHLVVSQSLSKATPKKISLRIASPEDLPLVTGDEEKLGWVMLQLLDNAIKFTPEKGCVKVKVSAGDGLVYISIEDTGIGISPEQIDEIFEPFHQLDGSVTRRYGGTGLGLAMVRRILEVHGSTPHVQSILGKGSKFTFSLPVAK